MFRLSISFSLWKRGDVIATVQSTLPDQPWHGKTLLSRGPRRFDFSDHVDDAENSGCGSCGSCDLVLANFSVLAPPRRGLHIATEKSGITIPQIQQLLDFVFTMVNMVGACRWAETFGDERGRPLSFEAFNLYHANCWIIGPATAATDAHEACSYVELLGFRSWGTMLHKASFLPNSKTLLWGL